MLKTLKFIVVIFFSSSILTQTNTWTGSTDTDWHKACNWSLNAIPTASDDVVIPNVATYPVITGNAHSLSLSITSTATNALTINSSGGGNLCVSSTNTGGCATVLTDNGGCTVPGSAFLNDGQNTGCNQDCVTSPRPYFSCGINMFNNTDFDITVVIPNLPGIEDSPGPGTYVINPGNSLFASFQLGFGTLSPNQCVGSGVVYTFNWSSSDGASGSFTLTTDNNI